MKIHIETTEISGNYIAIFKQFDEKLFRYLLPKFPPSKLEIFEGSKKGNVVQLKLGFLTWKSLITKDEINESEAYFIDKGVILPFPLKKWEHIHSVMKNTESSSTIIDSIEFSSGIKLIDIILYPIMKAMFSKRIKQYRKYFNEKQISYF